jgi:DedD protein
MDSALKQRLIGAAVLVALAMIFLPMLLKGPDVADPDVAQVPLDMPAAPDQEFETRELPLTLPTPETPEDGVLGLDTAPPGERNPDGLVTLGPDGRPVGGTSAEPAPDAVLEPVDDQPVDEAPVAAVDAASGEPVAPTPAAPEPESPAPVATTPAAAAAPLPVSTAGGRYVVNVGSFSNLANARALADKLRAQRLPLTSETVDVAGKPAMRLRVGPYAERTAAEAARLRVEAVAGGSATVIALDAASASRPAAAPAPSAPRPAAAASVGFAVQLGALSSEADASALRDRARAAGFVAFHQRVNTDRGAVWRVRVGPEADRAAADRLREQVASKLGLTDAIVVSHP